MRKILTLQPGGTYTTVEGKKGQSNLELLQQCVHGWIEDITYLFPELERAGIVVFGNEEAKLYHMPENVYVNFGNGQAEMVNGPMVFVRYKDEECSKIVELTAKDEKLIKSLFNQYMQMAVLEEDGIVPIRIAYYEYPQR
jgi:hypothetical protein